MGGRVGIWDGHGHAKLPIANLVLFTSDNSDGEVKCLQRADPNAYKLAEALSLSLEKECTVLPLMLGGREGSRRAVTECLIQLSVARRQQCIAAHA